MNVIGYLIGIEWYSGDQGDFPNLSEFPDRFIREREEAENAFKKLKEEMNDTWGFGYQQAYIAEIQETGDISARRYE